METCMAVKTVHFLAVVFTALALVPGGAHLFELPNKIDLDQNAYFTVQAIYRGWALFGIALFGALGFNLALAVLTREERTPFVLACLAFCVSRRPSRSSSPGRSRPIRRPRTGPFSLRTGKLCARDGSIRTR